MPGMKVSLMNHQLKAVKWMVDKENKPELGRKTQVKENGKKRRYGKAELVDTVGGGILADEMGLGKTIQSLATVVHNRPGPEEDVKVPILKI